MSDYEPINCAYYDQLEALAVSGRPIDIVYEENNQKKTVNAMIKDFYTKDKEEFMVLDEGPDIRLDSIVSADGKKMV